MSWVDSFGGQSVNPSDTLYKAYAFSANLTLYWPGSGQTQTNIVPDICHLTPSAASLSVLMPDARQGATGSACLFKNAGAETVTIKSSTGVEICQIAAGEAWYVYLSDNATAAGTWGSVEFGAGTSAASAASLASDIVKASGGLLVSAIPVTTKNSNFTIGATNRGEAMIWTGGVGTFSFDGAATLGADWYCYIKNAGSGALTLDPNASETIDDGTTIILNPLESTIVVCDGTELFTLGKSQDPTADFTYITIDVAGSGDYTLSAAQQGYTAYRFTGLLTGNRNIIVPNTVAEYWVRNITTGAFTLTVKTAAGTGVTCASSAGKIVYSDGTNVVDASTASISTPVAVAEGGTGATTASAARTNLGSTSIGDALFTAASTAAGRSAIEAAGTGVANTFTAPQTVSVSGGGSSIPATFTTDGTGRGLYVNHTGTSSGILVRTPGGAIGAVIDQKADATFDGATASTGLQFFNNASVTTSYARRGINVLMCGPSDTTGAHVIKQAAYSTANYQIIHIRGRDLSLGQFDIHIEGYNSSGTGFTTARVRQSGFYQPTVRIATTASNELCIVLGEIDTAWNAVIYTVDAVVGRAGASEARLNGWTLTRGVTDLTPYTTISYTDHSSRWTGDLSVTGNATLGDAGTDAHAVNGSLTVKPTVATANTTTPGLVVSNNLTTASAIRDVVDLTTYVASAAITGCFVIKSPSVATSHYSEIVIRGHSHSYGDIHAVVKFFRSGGSSTTSGREVTHYGTFRPLIRIGTEGTTSSVIVVGDLTTHFLTGTTLTVSGVLSAAGAVDAMTTGWTITAETASLAAYTLTNNIAQYYRARTFGNEAKFQAHGNGTNVTSDGVDWTATGTATSRTTTAGGTYTAIRRLGYVPASAATNVVTGVASSSGQWMRAWSVSASVVGGVIFRAVFNCPGFTVPGNRLFVGLAPNGTTTSGDPSAMLNCLGVGIDAADSNFFFMSNDGTGTATRVDTGIAIATNTAYEVTVYMPTGTQSLGYVELRQILSTAAAAHSFTTDLPSASVVLFAACQAGTGTLTTNGNIDVSVIEAWTHH